MKIEQAGVHIGPYATAKQRKSRLITLASLLEQLNAVDTTDISYAHLVAKRGDKAFLQQRWGLRYEDYESPSCGTAACTLGYAAMHKPFQDMGLTMRWGERYLEDEHYRWYGIPILHLDNGEKINDSYDAGIRFFGLNTNEAWELFVGIPPFTQASQATICKQLAKNIYPANELAENYST